MFDKIGNSGYKMKILHCIPNMKGGGAERQLTYLCKGLVSNGMEAHVALCDGGANMERLNDCGAVVHKLSSRHNHDVRVLLQLVKLIKKIRPNIIQTWLRQMDVLGGLAAIITSVPLIISERNSEMAYYRSWKHLLRALVGKKAAAVIANSGDGKRYWEKKTTPTVLKKVIRNMVPFDEIEKAGQDKLETDFDAKTRLIVSIASFTPQKNLLTMLRAFEVVMGRTDNVFALIFGQGSLQKELLGLQEKLGLNRRVKFMGFTAKVYAWLKRADVSVLVSHYEGNPNAVLEAIACKCPIVVSDICSHREFLDDSCAFFASTSDKYNIADQICRALFNKKEAEKKSNEAHNRILNLSIETIAQQYITTYQQVISPS